MGGGAGYYYLNWDRSTKGPTLEGTLGYQGGDKHPVIFGLNVMKPIGTKLLLPGLSVGYGF